MSLHLRFLFARLFVVSTLFAGVPLRAVDVVIGVPTDNELAPLLQRLQDVHDEQIAAWHFWSGRLGSKSVALTRLESDPLNACAATTLAIRHYSPRLLLVGSTARPHDRTLNAGDVVLSLQFAAFEGFESARRETGEGTDLNKWDTLTHLPLVEGKEGPPIPQFPAARLAVAAGLKAITGATVGTLGSAYQVNREEDRIRWLRSRWLTTSEDFVSAHVAGVAYSLKVPVAGLVVIDPDADLVPSPEAEKKVGLLLAQWLEVLP